MKRYTVIGIIVIGIFGFAYGSIVHVICVPSTAW
jgi:preprotein translocase subunit Sss1